MKLTHNPEFEENLKMQYKEALEIGKKIGAEEMRKSLRCETCQCWTREKHDSRKWIGYCEYMDSDSREDWGCICHEPKEEKL